MLSTGLKISTLKRNKGISISEENLNLRRGESLASEDSRTPDGRQPTKNEKHNLSSLNEQRRDLKRKLNEIYNTLKFTKIKPPPEIQIDNLEIFQNGQTKTVQQQQAAIYELLETEQNFLKQIHFIVQTYEKSLECVTPEFFPQINIKNVFSNIKEIYLASVEFWSKTMQPMIDDSTNYLNPVNMKEGFNKIHIILRPYIRYCTDISSCRSNILSLQKENELFAEFIEWAMKLEESNREILCDHLAKPFQRITKYQLLLQAILKHSNTEQISEIKHMINAVKAFLDQINERFEEQNSERKIQNINKLIYSYDVIESNIDDLTSIVNKYNKFNLTSQIQTENGTVSRQLIFEGDVKMRDAQVKLLDVRLMLFTDILCIMKQKKKQSVNLKVIKPPILLDTMEVHNINNQMAFICVVVNKFNCLDALYHFTTQDSKEWTLKLISAKKNFISLTSKVAKEYPINFNDYIPSVAIETSSPNNDTKQLISPSGQDDSVNNSVELIKIKESPEELLINKQTNLTPEPWFTNSRKSSVPNLEKLSITFDDIDIQSKRNKRNNNHHHNNDNNNDNNNNNNLNTVNNDTETVSDDTSDIDEIHIRRSHLNKNSNKNILYQNVQIKDSRNPDVYQRKLAIINQTNSSSSSNKKTNQKLNKRISVSLKSLIDL